MTFTHDLIIITKKNEMIRYCESHAIGGKVALSIVSINLTQVSIPAENGSNSHQSSHMPLRDQHSRAQSCS
jgi:hypothetical protein